MQWIAKLDEEGWNPIIDDLVWHLEQGRVVVRIRSCDLPESGVQFDFKKAMPAFLKIDRQELPEFWTSAAEIVAKFTELDLVELAGSL